MRLLSLQTQISSEEQCWRNFSRVRNKIWVATFERQHIDIDSQKLCFEGSLSYRSPTSLRNPTRPIFPVALHVNKESRFETLRHYAIAFPDNSRPLFLREETKGLPVCINLNLDVIFTNRCLSGVDGLRNHYSHYLTRMDSKS